MNEYAYPLNTVGKPEIMDRLLGFCRTKRGIWPGRDGENTAIIILIWW